MIRHGWVLALLLFLAMLPLSFRHRCPEAEVVKVVDGDTLKVIFKGRTEYVRLAGLDAPSLKEARGKEARDLLSRLCPVGSTVRLQISGRDVYNRLLATVYNENGVNVNRRLLEENLAVPFCRPR
jgi:endonuclease YncB( thermonuclease family)